MGEINCIACNRKIKKTFNNGYCFPCLQTLAECDLCIVKPELCHYDAGTCRDNEFAAEHCNIDHSIYLSLTSSVKIGITRAHQEQSRWVDQGASQALRLLTVPRRKHAGMIEVRLAKNLPDKTNWRKMLQNDVVQVDLIAERLKVENLIPTEVQEYFYSQKNDLYEMHFPVLEYPKKINSLSLEKTLHFQGKLTGIKGQYLLFEDGTVFNIRSSEGYVVRIEI